VNSGGEDRIPGMLSGVSKPVHGGSGVSYIWSLGGVSLRPGICSVQKSPFILLGKRGNKPSKQGKSFTIPEFNMWTVACAGKVKEKSSN